MNFDYSEFYTNSEGFSGDALINTIMNNSEDTVYFKDLDSKFLLNSTAHAVQLGVESPLELRGKSDFDFFPEQFAQKAYEIEQNIIKTGKPLINVVEKWDKPNGKVIWLSASKYPLKDTEGNIIGTWGTSRDITDLKEAEIELERLNAELQILNKAQKDNLEELKLTQEQLVEKEKMAALGHLVSGIAHEINTPIGVSVTTVSHLKGKISAFIKEFEVNAMTKTSFKEFIAFLKETSNIVSENLDKASKLITSFKQIAVDQTYYKNTKFNLKNYLETNIVSLKHELKKWDYDIVINCDDALILESYPGVFSQIITNFIMNTLLHGYDEGEKVKIVLTVEKNNDLLEILYKDFGQGIRPAVIEHIFEPFFTTSYGHGGSGLGMSIVYNLVTTKLKGEIVCEVHENCGAVFRIVLPGDIVLG